MNDAKAIKKHAAQYDLFNRLHSIAADERFVRKVAHDWYKDRFEVVGEYWPNQRCGTWYCDPSTSSKAYAYFKSTDGHTLNWDFNLRRSNLSLATYAEEKGGFIIVDSTRRGKRMPDGLSKTVPIWCAVVNRAVALRRAKKGGSTPDRNEWDVSLYLPAIVSPSERAQIEDRLDGWAEMLESSVLPLPDLKKPLRPFFIHPATSFAPEISSSAPFTPIVCLSASRWVNEDDGRGDVIPTATRLGDGFFARTVAFDYVPGAGDDDELWGRGLKPYMFHEHKSTLLSTPRDDLPSVVDDVVEDSQDLSRGLDSLHLGDKSTAAGMELGQIWSSATPVAPGLALDLGPTIQAASTSESLPSSSPRVTIRIVEVAKPLKDLPFVLPLSASDSDPIAVFAVPFARSNPKDYLPALSALVSYLTAAALKGCAVLLSPGRNDDLDAAIALHKNADDDIPAAPSSRFFPSQQLSAPDLQAARKAILPIAVAVMCAVEGLGGDDSVPEDGEWDKAAIADRLHRLVALWPDGNPPRAALKRVNELLMSDDHVY